MHNNRCLTPIVCGTWPEIYPPKCLARWPHFPDGGREWDCGSWRESIMTEWAGISVPVRPGDQKENCHNGSDDSVWLRRGLTLALWVWSVTLETAPSWQRYPISRSHSSSAKLHMLRSYLGSIAIIQGMRRIFLHEPFLTRLALCLWKKSTRTPCRLMYQWHQTKLFRHLRFPF